VPSSDPTQPGHVTEPTPAAPSDNTSLVEVLAALQQEGYGGDVLVDDDGALCCRACGTCVPADHVVIDQLRRLEGASDPADMAAVLALRCEACSERGTAVVRYGPEAGPGDAALLLALDRPGRSGGPPA
jgi:hypothetical protein